MYVCSSTLGKPFLPRIPKEDIQCTGRMNLLNLLKVTQRGFVLGYCSSSAFVCASVVSYVAFVLSLFVPHLSFFGAYGGQCFLIVTLPGYLHVYFLLMVRIRFNGVGKQTFSFKPNFRFFL